MSKPTVPGTYRLHLSTGKVDGVLSSEGTFVTFEGEVMDLDLVTFEDPSFQTLRVESVQALALKPDVTAYVLDKNGLLKYLEALTNYEADLKSSYPAFITNLYCDGEWAEETFGTRDRMDTFVNSDIETFGYDSTGVWSFDMTHEIFYFCENMDTWDAIEDFYATCFSSEVHEVLKRLKPFITSNFKAT